LNKKLSFLITAVCIFLSVSFANGTTTLMEIGRSPFHQPPLTSSNDLISMVQARKAEVEKGFALAGRADLFEAFIEQISTVQIDKVDFQKGSKFEWMFYKKKGKGHVRVVKDVTWGNDKPFPGFKFDIDKDGNRFAFAVPLGCGNVALVGMSKIPVVAAPPVAAPPVVPPVASAIEPNDVAEASKVGLVVDVGYYHQIDPGHYLFGRIGLDYKITEEFSVLGLVGAAPHIDGLDGKSAFIADLLGEYSFSRYFIDLGIGAWLTDGDDDIEAENSQIDLIASFGARIYGEPDAFNTSLFLEVRSAPDELSDLFEYGRFGVGVRFRF